MKHVLSAIMVSLLLATGVSAEEAAPQPVKASTTEDCSKQVWPNFSPACLRNGGSSNQCSFSNKRTGANAERSAPALSLAAASVLTVLLERGHGTVPNEQNTQQSPAAA